MLEPVLLFHCAMDKLQPEFLLPNSEIARTQMLCSPAKSKPWSLVNVCAYPHSKDAGRTCLALVGCWQSPHGMPSSQTNLRSSARMNKHCLELALNTRYFWTWHERAMLLPAERFGGFPAEHSLQIQTSLGVNSSRRSPRKILLVLMAGSWKALWHYYGASFMIGRYCTCARHRPVSQESLPTLSSLAIRIRTLVSPISLIFRLP